LWIVLKKGQVIRVNDIDIVNFSGLSVNKAKNYLIEMKDIFFKTSIKKDFQTPLQKEKYYNIWLGCYLDYYPEFTFLAVSDRRCVGYITGVSDSALEDHLFRINPIYDFYSELYHKYPAHLHMNCHPGFQSKGIGSMLIESFIDVLLQMNISGVHIITAQNARNVTFYRKMGFSFQRPRTFQGNELLFMARSL